MRRILAIAGLEEGKEHEPWNAGASRSQKGQEHRRSLESPKRNAVQPTSRLQLSETLWDFWLPELKGNKLVRF